MTLFGGMSKGERMRIKTRVRSAMASQTVTEGRFLGGRPPYGYRLVDAGMHPKPDKAAAGLRIRKIEADPETGPVVQRIFAEFLEGHGYYAIAERLTADSIESPSGRDRQCNSHRLGIAWGKSAVRAILLNPRYTGFQVWNKQRKDEILMDIEDVAAGHHTVMRWNETAEWVWSNELAHEALVTREIFQDVQALVGSRSYERKPGRVDLKLVNTPFEVVCGAPCASGSCKAAGITTNRITDVDMQTSSPRHASSNIQRKSTCEKAISSRNSMSGSLNNSHPRTLITLHLRF